MANFYLSKALWKMAGGRECIPHIQRWARYTILENRVNRYGYKDLDTISGKKIGLQMN